MDNKIQQKTTEELLLSLYKESYVRKFSMINLNAGDRVFSYLIQYIENNEYLRELDISWSEVRLSTYTKLLESLA